MKKAKTILFLFSNRNLKATKEQFIFYFFKTNDMQCIKEKTLIYMHIKRLYVLFLFSFINAKEKLPTNKIMHMRRTKQKELCYIATKQTLESHKVSINPTWKEGLHKIQVNYFGMVKLTNKRRRKPTPTSF